MHLIMRVYLESRNSAEMLQIDGQRGWKSKKRRWRKRLTPLMLPCYHRLLLAVAIVWHIQRPGFENCPLIIFFFLNKVKTAPTLRKLWGKCSSVSPLSKHWEAKELRNQVNLISATPKLHTLNLQWKALEQTQSATGTETTCKTWPMSRWMNPVLVLQCYFKSWEHSLSIGLKLLTFRPWK